MQHQFLVTLCLCLLTCWFVKSAMLQGKPVVEVKKFYPCDDFENVITLFASIRNHNKSVQAITGNMTFLEKLDASYKVKAVVSRLINGAWHKDITLVKNDPCNTMQNLLGPVYAQLLKQAHIEGCPIKAGSYSVTEFPLDAHTIPLIYATGMFKLDAELIKKPNTLKFCYHVEALITIEK